MPLVGFFGGRLVGNVAGSAADYLAILILIALGVYVFWPKREEKEQERLGLLGRTHGLAAIGLGISVSMDELAIGFTIGLLRFSIFLVVILIGVQTFVVTQLGVRLGARVGERVREGAERLAGIALTVLGLILLVDKLVH